MLWLLWLAIGFGFWLGAFAVDRPGNWAYQPVWVKLLPFGLMTAVPLFLVLPYFASRSFLWGTVALILGAVGTFVVAAGLTFGLKGK